MKKYFITYGDERFADAKARLALEAMATGEFDEVFAYGPDVVGEQVRKSPLWAEARGGGYWIWKPEVVLQTLNLVQDGDIVVYADAGCEVVAGGEWRRYWKALETHDLIAQRLYQRNRNWTRRALAAAFKGASDRWLERSQVLATVVMLRKSPFTVRLIAEWRQLMLSHPELVRDVTTDERALEAKGFVENRHDQAVFSALVYRALADANDRRRICLKWEHIENLSAFRSQVIRAMRNGQAVPVGCARRWRERLWRLLKDVLKRPYYALRYG